MHYSAQVALMQAITSVSLAIFFVHHSWRYDQFDCLRIYRLHRAGRSREAFKRLMVYLYLLGAPAFAVQGGFYAFVKYEVGTLPKAYGGMPVPYTMWPAKYLKLVVPLQYLNAFAWTCELVVHLEELMFFLHLVALTKASRPWFRSWYFKVVAVGTLISAFLTFGSVALYQHDPLKGEAVLYLCGSSFIILSNLVFFRIFYVFPKFLANLKTAGGTGEVVIRLKTFHELNKIRVTARFGFGIPLFILSFDGLTEKAVLNHSLLWTDLLLLVGLAGFSVQAICTLLIFMPRNLAREAGVIAPINSSFQAQSASLPVAANVLGTKPVVFERTPTPMHKKRDGTVVKRNTVVHVSGPNGSMEKELSSTSASNSMEKGESTVYSPNYSFPSSIRMSGATLKQEDRALLEKEHGKFALNLTPMVVVNSPTARSEPPSPSAKKVGFSADLITKSPSSSSPAFFDSSPGANEKDEFIIRFDPSSQQQQRTPPSPGTRPSLARQQQQKSSFLEFDTSDTYLPRTPPPPPQESETDGYTELPLKFPSVAHRGLGGGYNFRRRSSEVTLPVYNRFASRSTPNLELRERRERRGDIPDQVLNFKSPIDIL